MLIVNLIGVISLGSLVYARPRELTLVIDERGIVITDRCQRVLVSKRLSEVAGISFGRWGHLLNFDFCWIVLRESGRSKPSYFGAISGQGLDAETIPRILDSFEKTKAESEG